jgi:hypothetical protein
MIRCVCLFIVRSCCAGAGELALKERFSEFQLAVNVLKHGRGRSYDALVAKAGSLKPLSSRRTSASNS